MHGSISHRSAWLNHIADRKRFELKSSLLNYDIKRDRE